MPAACCLLRMCCLGQAVGVSGLVAELGRRAPGRHAHRPCPGAPLEQSIALFCRWKCCSRPGPAPRITVVFNVPVPSHISLHLSTRRWRRRRPRFLWNGSLPWCSPAETFLTHHALFYFRDLCAQMEEVLFPILERYTSTDGQDIFEEIMQLATYLTYFAPEISPRMWTLYPRMLQARGPRRGARGCTTARATPRGAVARGGANLGGPYGWALHTGMLQAKGSAAAGRGRCAGRRTGTGHPPSGRGARGAPAPVTNHPPSYPCCVAPIYCLAVRQRVGH